MKAGSLDRIIVIERFTETRDDFNAVTKSWYPLARVSAQKVDVRDSERLAQKEIGADITSRFTVRWSTAISDVNAKDRIRYGSQVFEVVAVKEIGRREGFEISAAARSDG